MKLKKSLSVILSIFTLLTLIPSFSARAAENDKMIPNKEDAVRIITQVEEIYDALDIMTRDLNSSETKNRIKEIPYEVRDSDNYVHFDHMTLVFETEYSKEEAWIEYLDNTFTEEMSKKIINESCLLFKNGKAYLPMETKQQKYCVVSLHEQNYVSPLVDRISDIVETGQNKYTISYYGWRKDSSEKYNTETDENGKTVIIGEPELLEIKVERIGSELKVYDYDNVFFVEDNNSKLSAEGKRRFRFIADNPQTSDAPLVAVCALALSAAAAVILLKKKKTV